MNALEVSNIVVQYPRTDAPAVAGVSLCVAAGNTLGLVGASGCGKSTVAKAIMGLVPLTSGTIKAANERVHPLGLRRRPSTLLSVQMVFQNPYASLNPRRTVREQLSDALKVGAGKWTLESLMEAVELPSATLGRYPAQFSGGQLQRIAIARAIATEPTVLIGDEPIASLDASLQSWVALLLRNLARESNAALLFISHDLAIVRDIADEVAVMSAGRIIETGTTEQVWNRPREEFTAKLVSSVMFADGKNRL